MRVTTMPKLGSADRQKLDDLDPHAVRELGADPQVLYDRVGRDGRPEL